MPQSVRHWLTTHVSPLLPQRWTPLELVVFCLGTAGIGLTVVVIHELGHVLGGRLAGFNFHTIAVGPIQVNRHPFREGLYRGPLALRGGWVSMFPIKRDHLRERALVLVSAGPLLNLMTASVWLVLPFSAGLYSYFFILVRSWASPATCFPCARGTSRSTDG